MTIGTSIALGRRLVYPRGVSFRRFLPLLILVALALAPFGRMNMAEAKAMPHAMPTAMADHCAGQLMPDQDKNERMAVDCMIACAAMAPAPACVFAPPPVAETVRASMPIFFPTGIRPEAEPPPPRFS